MGAQSGGRRIARLTSHVSWILVLLITVVFASTLAPVARGQYNAWTRQFGTSANDLAFGIDADASGVYVAGVTWGTLPGQTSSGGTDAFVRKYDALGMELWTHQFGTSLHDEARGLAVDASGVYVAGYTGATFPHLSGADAFVRKYDADGTEIWTRQFEDSSSDIARAISVDASGVYVAGFASGAGWDAFVRKYDASGTEVWTRLFGTSTHDRAEAISVDASGVYVAGGTHGTLHGQTSSGPGDAFVRKYDADGTDVWTRQFGTSLSESAYAIAVDSSGIYVAGSGSGGEFFRKYDADGTDVWTRGDSVAALSIDDSGVYVAAGGSVRKYDAAGTVLWTHPFADPSGNTTWAISVDASEIYVAGATLGTLSGQTSLGGWDAFVIRLSSEAPDVRIDADPVFLRIPLGGSDTSTLTLRALQGYLGIVGLTVSIEAMSVPPRLPTTHPTATLDPEDVTLADGGTARSTLTVSAPLLTTPGTYAITVTATSGTITHSVTIAVEVTLL